MFLIAKVLTIIVSTFPEYLYSMVTQQNKTTTEIPLQCRHNGCDSVSNHQPHHCLLNRLFWHRSKKTSKLRVTGLCVRNSPVTGEFPAQKASNAENVSFGWRHHGSEVNVWHLLLILHHPFITYKQHKRTCFHSSSRCSNSRLWFSPRKSVSGSEKNAIRFSVMFQW